MLKEIWKNVDGTNGYYQVSNLGRIRSYHNFNEGRRDEPVFLKASVGDVGYREVSLKVNGRYKNERLHRVIAKTFIPNPKNKRTVNHKNGIKTDNRVVNLEWATDSENHKHAFATGLKEWTKEQKKKVAGCNSYNSVVDKDTVVLLRKLYDNGGITQTELARKFNLTVSVVHRIVNRITYKYIK